MKDNDLPVSEGAIIDISVRRYTFDVKVLSKDSGAPKKRSYKARDKEIWVYIISELNSHNPNRRDFQIIIKDIEKGKKEKYFNFIAGDINGDDEKKMKKVHDLITHLSVEGSLMKEHLDESSIKRTHQRTFLY